MKTAEHWLLDKSIYFIYVYVRMYICTYKTGIVSRNTRGSKRFKQRLSTQKTEITKQVLTMKLEAVCIKFRQAVDSGRINGHGRVVFLYLIFVNIFSATEQILSGVESTDVNDQ